MQWKHSKLFLNGDKSAKFLVRLRIEKSQLKPDKDIKNIKSWGLCLNPLPFDDVKLKWFEVDT